MLTVPIFAVVGGLVGWATWVVGKRLAAGALGDERPRYAPAVLCVALGGGLVASAALRSGNDPAAIARVSILATPLLITLATDLLDRLVFPIVLVPGMLGALLFAAIGPIGLQGAVVSGIGAGVAAALLVIVSRRLWSETAEPPLGSGDILIAATIGAILGPERTAGALFAGMVLGAGAAGLLLLSRRARRGDPLPYGAFLCLSALVALAV